ncbi:MAG: nuclear transport factor 2 family protein [Planktomarina sp.]|nr:nuclear transport factor 2 family protein [Planktomarina sp.]
MTPTHTLDPWQFAQDWQDGWNSHDLDRIMAHYHEEVVFRSTKTQALVGKGKLTGHDELRGYWAEALKRQPDLKFQVQDVFQGHEMLVLSYSNQNNICATETFYFNTEGLVFRAAACHQAPRR